jgi:tetratricopeptide (TPR) repeat protein
MDSPDQGWTREAERLQKDVELALRQAVDPGEVLPLLHRLARAAAEGTDESVFAHRNLAELLVERDPWRASLHARKVVAHREDDDRGWAMLGLCQTLLGNYRFAVSAYHSALRTAPKNPWYSHNLGHLLDVALGRPKDALPWLRAAYTGATWNAEVAASYAHALARAGELGQAKKVVAQAMKKGGSREHAALLKWIEQGAPPGKDASSSASGAPPPPSPAPARVPLLTRSAASRPRRRKLPADEALAVESALARGLATLPLDAKQRGRARDLLRDALQHFGGAGRGGRVGASAPSAQALAAAVAYAIVYVDHVPLKPAEVAATFRVSAAALRGRFAELRAHLDLTPGDARYATLRRR